MIPAGVGVRIDNAQAQPLVFQKSDQSGVYAALPLTDKLVGDLKKGKSLSLVVQINKGEDMPIAGALNGFAQAYDKIVSLR